MLFAFVNTDVTLQETATHCAHFLRLFLSQLGAFVFGGHLPPSSFASLFKFLHLFCFFVSGVHQPSKFLGVEGGWGERGEGWPLSNKSNENKV